MKVLTAEVHFRNGEIIIVKEDDLAGIQVELYKKMYSISDITKILITRNERAEFIKSSFDKACDRNDEALKKMKG